MKGTGKFILLTGLVSAFILFYVHLHQSLFLLSYTIYDHSHELSKRNEEYRHLKFEVNQLKAPNRLAEEMTERGLKLERPSEIYVVRAPLPKQVELPAIEATPINPLSRGLMEFLGRWVNIAQAKMDAK